MPDLNDLDFEFMGASPEAEQAMAAFDILARSLAGMRDKLISLGFTLEFAENFCLEMILYNMKATL